MSDADFIRKSVFMLGGLLVWAAHFTFVYGFNTLACARHFWDARVFGTDVVTAVVTAATVGALLVVTGILLVAWRRRSANPDADEEPVTDFMRYTAISVAGLSFVAILWTGLPVFLVSPCN